MSKHEAAWQRGYPSKHQAKHPSAVQPNEVRLGAAVRQKKRSKLIQFIQRYPLALLLIAWLVFLLIAGLAVVNMVSIDASKSPANSQTSASIPSPAATTSPTAAPAQPFQTAPSVPAERTEPASLPIQSLVAIGLSCAIGCLIILQWLKPSRPAKRMQPPALSNPSSARASARQRTASSRTSSATAQRTVSPPSASPQAASSTSPNHSISVVPADLSHPLDWDDPSLADSLDIRQKKPLSHWL
ncbi:MAG TPA: hypothetical protein V6C57_14745 [Coleofasciculaceae cyanobacterium]